MLKAYIAGFDVFKDDSEQISKAYRIYLKDHQIEGLYPSDNIEVTSKDIFKANIDLINKADIVIANINDFRGDDPDSGTVFEIGYAHALGKRVYAYRDDTKDMTTRLGRKDKDGYNVENFGNPVNLMIAESVEFITEGTFYDCVDKITIHNEK